MAADPAPEPKPSDTLLELRGLGRRYGVSWALRGVELVCAAPEVVGLVGANGSGKTTLLRIVAQLLEPTEGSVRLLGRTVPRSGSAAARRHVGFASHEPFAWRVDSVLRNLDYAAALAGCRPEERARLVERVVDAWQLSSRTDVPVRELSRGWQQRFACARADLLEPRVVLLDEPTVGLDAAGRELLELAIARWRTERLVIVSSHDREWLAARAGRLVDLDAVASA